MVLLQDSLLVLHEDRPFRLSVPEADFGMVGLTVLSYTLRVYDAQGDMAAAAESLEAVPVIAATADWVAATGVVLMSQAPTRYDATAAAGERAGVGSYRVTATVFNDLTGRTEEMLEDPVLSGTMVVRFAATRPPLSFFRQSFQGGRPGAGCGCSGRGGRAIAACGCGETGGAVPGDGGLVTRRARTRGTWKGTYDPAVDYPKGSVVTAEGRSWIKLC